MHMRRKCLQELLSPPPALHTSRGCAAAPPALGRYKRGVVQLWLGAVLTSAPLATAAH